MRTLTAVIWVTVTHSHVKTSSQPNMSLRTLFPRTNSSATAGLSSSSVRSRWTFRTTTKLSLCESQTLNSSFSGNPKCWELFKEWNYLNTVTSEWLFHYSLQSVRVCVCVCVCVPLHISVTVTDLSLISRYLYAQRTSV